MSEELTDHDLIQRIRNGDESAATALHRRYAVRLHRLAERKISISSRPTAEPEDIVQSVFKSLFRGVNSGSYQAPDSQSLWSLLAVIAIHKISRRVSRSRSVKARAFPTTAEGEPTFEEESQVSPEQFESSVQEVLEMLSPLEQSVARLRIEGYLVEEISDKLGRSARTIERNLQQIRQKLSELLDDEDP